MIVKYSKKFPYAPYLNEDIGFELDIDMPKMNEELILATLYSLKSIAEKFHKDNNPQLTDAPIAFEEIPINKPLQSIDRNAIDRLEKLIDDCQDPAELRPHGDDAEKYGLSGYFNSRMKELLFLKHG